MNVTMTIATALAISASIPGTATAQGKIYGATATATGDGRGRTTMKKFSAVAALALLCAACAGRDPQPIATVQATDANASCTMIAAEIEANNIKVKELAGEEGGKVAQNVAAGVGGLFIPVLWFAMDFKGAASKEVTALQARQQYLATLATERCKPQRQR